MNSGTAHYHLFLQWALTEFRQHFLAVLNPVGSIFSSFFIQHITVGGAYLDKAIYCTQISDLISAIIIYLCGLVLFMKYVMNSRIAKEEKKAEAEDKKGGEA